MQFASESSQKSLYDFMFKSGDYTKSVGEFYNQFFTKKVEVKKEEPIVEETTEEVKTKQPIIGGTDFSILTEEEEEPALAPIPR